MVIGNQCIRSPSTGVACEWFNNPPRLDEWQDAYKASKNAYFVFRVMNLGCQLAEHGCIRDLKAANAKWDSWCYQCLHGMPHKAFRGGL